MFVVPIYPHLSLINNLLFTVLLHIFIGGAISIATTVYHEQMQVAQEQLDALSVFHHPPTPETTHNNTKKKFYTT